MYPRYYALRRLNPCRGVVQVVAAGDAAAHSYDGVTWHLRGDDGHGWVRPTGIWQEGVGLKAGQAANLGDLLPALETRPALPFRLIDSQELWLLDKEDGLPLALLATLPRGVQPPPRPAAAWQPFVASYTGFVSPSLAAREASDPHAPARHGEVLARQVNQRAHPAAQWFERTPAGEGCGGPGLGLAPDWRGRQLPDSAFPELLVRESWNSRLEKSVIADYHVSLAPILLCWPRLSLATRARLETAACAQRQWLARVQRLLPCRVDAARIQAALVAAKLEEAAGDSEPDWN